MEDDDENKMDVDNPNYTDPDSPNQQKTKAALNRLSSKCENVKIFTSKMADSIYKQFRKKK